METMVEVMEAITTKTDEITKILTLTILEALMKDNLRL